MITYFWILYSISSNSGPLDATKSYTLILFSNKCHRSLWVNEHWETKATESKCFKRKLVHSLVMKLWMQLTASVVAGVEHDITSLEVLFYPGTCFTYTGHICFEIMAGLYSLTCNNLYRLVLSDVWLLNNKPGGKSLEDLSFCKQEFLKSRKIIPSKCICFETFFRKAFFLLAAPLRQS